MVIKPRKNSKVKWTEGELNTLGVYVGVAFVIEVIVALMVVMATGAYLSEQSGFSVWQLLKIISIPVIILLVLVPLLKIYARHCPDSFITICLNACLDGAEELITRLVEWSRERVEKMSCYFCLGASVISTLLWVWTLHNIKLGHREPVPVSGLQWEFIYESVAFSVALIYLGVQALLFIGYWQCDNLVTVYHDPATPKKPKKPTSSSAKQPMPSNHQAWTLIPAGNQQVFL